MCEKTQAQEKITHDHGRRPQNEQVQIDDYIVSWENYCRLFDALLDCSDTNFVISEAWAFDLINEFVYQFQSFCQKRPQVGLSLPLPSGPCVMVHSIFDGGCSTAQSFCIYLRFFFFVDSDFWLLGVSFLVVFDGFIVSSLSLLQYRCVDGVNVLDGRIPRPSIQCSPAVPAVRRR